MLATLIIIVCVIGVVMTMVAYCILAERKIAAWVQDRVGPNRAGPWGILQPLADGAKFFFKEDIIPWHVDKILFVLAPMMSMAPALLGIAIIPFGGQLLLEGWEQPVAMQIAPGVSIGILYILAVTSLGVYGIILGGWASNNKYSLLGAMRSSAQILSYEVPLGISLLCILLMVGSLMPEDIVAGQTGSVWFIVYQPVVFLIFLICSFAETNRLPFDLAESEQELVGGFHTEYSALKFGMFFLAEYANIITACALITVLFLGGWDLPFVTGADAVGGAGATALKIVVFFAKVCLLIFFFMWVRWTLPRFRYDQLLRITWKGLTPLAMIMLVVTAIMVYFKLANTMWMLAANVVAVVGVYVYLSLSKEPVTGRQAGMIDVK